MEPLTYKHGVDVFFYGHVHAYERTAPMVSDAQKCTKHLYAVRRVPSEEQNTSTWPSVESEYPLYHHVRTVFPCTKLGIVPEACAFIRLIPNCDPLWVPSASSLALC